MKSLIVNKQLLLSIDEELEEARSRLEFVNEELLCPMWMLGNVYRYKLATERRELKNRLRRLTDE